MQVPYLGTVAHTAFCSLALLRAVGGWKLDESAIKAHARKPQADVPSHGYISGLDTTAGSEGSPRQGHPRLDPPRGIRHLSSLKVADLMPLLAYLILTV